MGLFEFFIGFRYLKSKKSQGFISFNTLLSMIIIFIGVFILIVVISVMNGFQAQIKDKILDVDSHVTVSNLAGQFRGNRIIEYRKVSRDIAAVPGVRSVSPFIQGQALLRHETDVIYVMIRGIGSPGHIPDDVVKFISKGKEQYTKEEGVFIGEEMAANYNLKVGKYVEIIVPKGQLTATTGVVPGLGTYKILGFFKTGYYDFDTKLIVMSLPDAQKLYAVGDVVWEIGVKIEDVFRMKDMSARIQSSIGFEYITMTAEDKNHNLFYALKLEKLIMTIILFLVIISAGFTIMGTLVMVVMEKRKAIGILKAMGAGPNSIMIIFVMEGFLIGVIGAFSGVIFGVAAALNLEAIIKWIENAINSMMNLFYGIYNGIGSTIASLWGRTFEAEIFYKINLVPVNVYYIDSVPTEVKPEFVVFIAVFAVFLSTVAAIFPAWNASRQKPVETIRYE